MLRSSWFADAEYWCPEKLLKLDTHTHTCALATHANMRTRTRTHTRAHTHTHTQEEQCRRFLGPMPLVRRLAVSLDFEMIALNTEWYLILTP